MNLNVYYQIVRGLKTKTCEFRSSLRTSSYDVIILCETWLWANFFTSEFFDDRYIVFRKDPDNAAIGKKYGGGCIIAVKKGLYPRR